MVMLLKAKTHAFAFSPEISSVLSVTGCRQNGQIEIHNIKKKKISRTNDIGEGDGGRKTIIQSFSLGSM